MRVGRSAPVIPVQAAILHRFGEVLGRHRIRLVHVGDRTRQLQYPVVRAPPEPSPPHPLSQSPLPKLLARTALAQTPPGYTRSVISAPALQPPPRHHTLADSPRARR